MANHYRCVTTSVEGFVQQLAASYLRHGYWWYVCGLIPAWKDSDLVDAKLLSKYGIDVSESTRARRKRAGQANLQYLRFERFFALLATKGKHPFFEQEAGAIRDIRRVPIKFQGYSISYRPGGRTRAGEKDATWHAHVEIERSQYKELKARLLELAKHRSAANLVLEFYRLPFEPYAPIRRQMLNLLRAVNRVRQQAGFELLPKEVLPLRRRVVKPFQPARVNASVLAISSVRQNENPPRRVFGSMGTAQDGVSVRVTVQDSPLRCFAQVRSPRSDL